MKNKMKRIQFRFVDERTKEDGQTEWETVFESETFLVDPKEFGKILVLAGALSLTTP